MEIALLVIGKTSNKDIARLTDFYVDRLKHYVPFRIIEIPDARKGRNTDPAMQKTKEGELILGAVSSSDHVCLLDER